MKKKEEKALVEATSNLPDFLRDQGQGRGNEKIDTGDLMMPRVKLLQPLSPEVEEGRIPVGHMCNSLTGEDYGTSLVFIPVIPFKSRIYWKPREEGGGILCSALDALHPSKDEYAKSCIYCEKCKWDNVNHKAPDCTIYYNFIILPEGSNVPVALSMEKTKVKTAKKLITLAKYVGGNLDMFAKKYKISTEKVKNDFGTYFNYVVEPVGFVTENEFKIAEKVYDEVKGAKISVEQENE